MYFGERVTEFSNLRWPADQPYHLVDLQSLNLIIFRYRALGLPNNRKCKVPKRLQNEWLSISAYFI